jgi:uncharacterized RDD family membrane protein YckC
VSTQPPDDPQQPGAGQSGGYGAPPPPAPPYGSETPPPAYGGQPGYGAPPAYGQPTGYGQPGGYGEGGYGAPPQAGPPYKGQALGLPPVGPNSLSSQWMRLLARIIDGIIIAIPAILIGLALTDPGDRGTPGFAQYNSNSVVASLIGLAIGAAYEIYFLSSRGATPGKSLLGMRVARVSDGHSPTAQEAAIRWAVPNIPGFFPIIGIFSLVDVLWCLWDPNRQCLHDKVAKTVVVQTK